MMAGMSSLFDHLTGRGPSHEPAHVPARRPIGIMAAMPQELQALLDLMPDEARVRRGGRDFWCGHLAGQDVVAVLSGIGKVAAATTATLLADAPTRLRMLHAALDLFGRHGFDATTTRMLTQAAGVNLGAIPYHFGSKEGLVAALYFCALDDQSVLANQLDDVRSGANQFLKFGRE